jgi:hypothetical protein
MTHHAFGRDQRFRGTAVKNASFHGEGQRRFSVSNEPFQPVGGCHWPNWQTEKQYEEAFDHRGDHPADWLICGGLRSRKTWRLRDGPGYPDEQYNEPGYDSGGVRVLARRPDE